MLLLWNQNTEVQLGSACDCERLVDNCVTVTLKQASRAEPSRAGPRPDTRTRTSWTGERRLQWLGRLSFLLLLPRGPVRSFGSGSGPSALRVSSLPNSPGFGSLDPGASCCRTPLFVFIRRERLLLLLLLLLLLHHLLLILLLLFRLLPSCVSAA